MRPLLVPLLAILVAAGLVLPAIDATSSVGAPVGELLVEGHTVFATLTASGTTTLPPLLDAAASRSMPEATPLAATRAPAPGGEAPAAADGEPSAYAWRDPGTRWFNDQFLLPPRYSVTTTGGQGSPVLTHRFHAAVAVLVEAVDAEGRVYHPCGGALLLTDAGAPDPRVGQSRLPLGLEAAGWSHLAYRESYLVTDPNDHTWVMDRYEGTTAERASVFVVNVGGGPVFRPDLGDACDPRVDTPPAQQPSRNGYCYNGAPASPPPCAMFDGPQTVVHMPARQYNALLHVPLETLAVEGAVRDHWVVTDPWDTNGCQVGTAWPCPGDSDDAEGFSHPFALSWPPKLTSGRCPDGYTALGPTNHGGSAREEPACEPVHATFHVDLYASGQDRPPVPPVRTITRTDAEGSGAGWMPTPE